MSLKDVLVKPSPRTHKTWLEVCKQQMDKDDFDHLINVLKNPDEFPAPYIADIMTKQGFPVSATTVQSTRRKLNG